MRSASRKPDWQKKIARERIDLLFQMAGKQFAKRPDRSERYVALARRIGMRYKVTLSRELKRQFCKGCGHYLKPGVNARVRSRKDIILMTCQDCGAQKRIPTVEKA